MYSMHDFAVSKITLFSVIIIIIIWVKMVVVFKRRTTIDRTSTSKHSKPYVRVAGWRRCKCIHNFLYSYPTCKWTYSYVTYLIRTYVTLFVSVAILLFLIKKNYIKIIDQLTYLYLQYLIHKCVTVQKEPNIRWQNKITIHFVK